MPRRPPLFATPMLAPLSRVAPPPAVLPFLKELHLTNLPTHLTSATALYRNVDDVFQITWAPSLITLLQLPATVAMSTAWTRPSSVHNSPF